jgi:uncharacterized protein (TIGR04255 family)
MVAVRTESRHGSNIAPTSACAKLNAFKGRATFFYRAITPACYAHISHYISHIRWIRPVPNALPPPLGGSPPPEINLARSPLVRVLAQVPGILKIENKDVVALFQEEIRRDYPLFEQQPTQHVEVQLGPSGPTVKQVPGTNWRFQDAKRNWRLSLSTDALSFEVESYTSRGDFLARWTKAIAAVERIFEPRIALRIGMRYIDRVTDKPLEAIDGLVHADILGFARPPLREHVHRAMSEATLSVEEGEMLLRWGIMPANTTVDPTVLPPIPHLSWILDIDVSSSEQRTFDNSQLGASFRALAERAYAVFRYMTTDEFLKTYGGAV